MKTIAFVSAVACLALAACASAVAVEDPATKPAPAQRACFFASQVNNWTSDRDEKVAYLYVGANDVYRAELFGRCLGLDDALSIGVQSRAGGSSICSGLDVDLLVQSPIGPQRCPVTSLTKLTPDEVAAMKQSKKRK